MSELKSVGIPQNWLVVYNFSGTASDGKTFSLRLAKVADVTAVRVNSGQPVNPKGFPVLGAIKTVGWVAETIDTAGSEYPTSIALDSNNRPHIGYSHYLNSIRYAHK